MRNELGRSCACALLMSVLAPITLAQTTAPSGRPFSSPPAGPLVVRIGHAGPLTGALAGLGKDDENGVALAIEQANQAGIKIGGRSIRFEMVSRDDKNHPWVGTTVAQELVAAKVVAVIGHLGSGVTIPASEIYNKAGIPLVAGAATNPRLTERGMKTVFRTIGRDDQQGPAIAAYIAKGLHAKSVAIVDDKTAYGESLADDVEAALKGAAVTIVGREHTTDKATDFKAILTRIRARNPDVVFHGGMDETAAPMLKQARELGITATFAFGDGACLDQMDTLAGQAAEGMVCSQGGAPPEAASKDFVDAYRAKYGEIRHYAPYFYDGTLAVIAAMRRVDSVNPVWFTPQMFRISIPGATGKVDFDSKGDRKDAVVTIFRMNGGKVAPVSIVTNGAVADIAKPGGAQGADAAVGACDSGLQSRSTRFVVKGAEATDTKTGLIWQRCSVGQTWSPREGCLGAAKGFKWNELAQAAGKGWRVPTQAELGAIQEVGCADACDPLDKAEDHCPAAVDKGVFPNTPAHMYWSTTVYPDKNPGFAYFGEGGGGGSGPAEVGMFVRLVRDQK